ncbi:hypothetical protein [Actinoplanes regularis]|uniref:Uncharacterized protein n=1 Tax=Actinoplanes regularis TaxID=52697 RepID=A0A239IY85_9ACTN|nr:hypothetical protein [Actinoplanes regularis]GIE91607.1 hypothetical protein Are01nite_80870 [Actinoplanes regularis]SNS97973.1 hypothetical protein SAMN06264365_13147 [Actinoplanes regularis]
MRDHPCHQHRPGHHTDACLNGGCGFCGTPLDRIASGECRACLRIACEACDAGYQPDLGPICQPCAPSAPTSTTADGEVEYRLCVFEFDLSCGHTVTVALTGWYPVIVRCCDRLGGTILRGDYRPFASDIDYVRVVSERYEVRPKGTPPGSTEVIGRRPRTDEPYHSRYLGIDGSTGRYPARVGATWSLDGSIAKPETT